MDEFVPPNIYYNFGEKARWFIRPELIALAQFYRDWFGAPVTVNTWYFGGVLQERGYREPNSKTGAKYSQHKFGTAFDCNIRGITPDEIRRVIGSNEESFMKAGLTTLEHGSYAPTWVHSDMRDTGMSKILIVKPATTQMVEERFIFDTNDFIKIG